MVPTDAGRKLMSVVNFNIVILFSLVLFSFRGIEARQACSQMFSVCMSVWKHAYVIFRPHRRTVRRTVGYFGATAGPRRPRSGVAKWNIPSKSIRGITFTRLRSIQGR